MIYITVCFMTFLGTGYWAGKLYGRFLSIPFTPYNALYKTIVALSFWTMRFACWFSMMLIFGMGVVMYYLYLGYRFDPLVYYLLDRQSIWMVWLMIAMMIIDLTFFKFEYVVPAIPSLVTQIDQFLTLRPLREMVQAILTTTISSVFPQWKGNMLLRWALFCSLFITGALISEIYIYVVGCFIGYNRHRFNHTKHLMGLR